MSILNRIGLNTENKTETNKDDRLYYAVAENYKISSIELENIQLKDAINETISASQESETIVKKDRNLLQKTWDKFIEFVNKIIKFIKRVALKIRRFFYKSRLEKIDYVLSKNKKPKYVTKIYSEKKMSESDLQEIMRIFCFGKNTPNDQQPRLVFSTLMYNTPIGAEVSYLRILIGQLEDTIRHNSHVTLGDKLLKKEGLESHVRMHIYETVDKLHGLLPDFLKFITEDKLNPNEVTDERIKIFASNIKELYDEVYIITIKDYKDGINSIYNRYLNVLEKIKTEKINNITTEYIDYMTKLVKDIQIRVQWVNEDIDKFFSAIEDIYGLK